MESLSIIEHARKLYAAHGDKAEVEAAQKARQHEENGDTEQAETWNRIRAAIKEMRSGHVS